jgi:hypothetical protein
MFASFHNYTTKCSSFRRHPFRRPFPSGPSASSTPIQGFGFRFFRSGLVSIPASVLLCIAIISIESEIGKGFARFVTKLKYCSNITT